jgi:CMP-N-acetylneuraminic acid synthetase
LKNIKSLRGRPLVFWVLDAATNCPKIERIFVATDNAIIAKVLMGYGSPKLEVLGRTAASATDTVQTELAMLEFAVAHDFDNIAIIQATSPLLQAGHLEEGFERLAAEEVDSVLSVVRQKRFIWEEQPDHLVAPYNYDPANRPLRQNFEGFLVENGAFYMTSKELLIKNRCRLSGKISFVEMPEASYFEIDEAADWLIVEELMKQIHQTLLPPSTTITAPLI